MTCNVNKNFVFYAAIIFHTVLVMSKPNRSPNSDSTSHLPYTDSTNPDAITNLLNPDSTNSDSTTNLPNT